MAIRASANSGISLYLVYPRGRCFFFADSHYPSKCCRYQDRPRREKKKLCRLIVILFTFKLKSNREKEIYHARPGVRYDLKRIKSETMIYMCHLTRGFRFRVQEEEEEEEERIFRRGIRNFSLWL